jgi:hypothetical protein
MGLGELNSIIQLAAFGAAGWGGAHVVAALGADEVVAVFDLAQKLSVAAEREDDGEQEGDYVEEED